MFIIREVFKAKPGHASKLAKLFKAVFAAEPNVRVMTDLVGEYNTVVMEFPVKTLAEFEAQMQAYRSGVDPKMDPKLVEEMSRYTEMYVSGRREIYQLVE